MLIANFEKMLKNGFDASYEYLNHTWTNQTRNCGCKIAICIDIEPNIEDARTVAGLITKRSVLQTYIKNSSTILDGLNKEAQLNEFKNELIETQEKLNTFIKERRKEYDFPQGIDFNAEFYYIKLWQSPTCHSD
jgi:hypothetical protein